MSWMVAGKSTVTLPIQRTPSATRATMPRSSSDTVISSTASGLPSAFSTTLRSGFSGISDAPSSPFIRASTSSVPQHLERQRRVPGLAGPAHGLAGALGGDEEQGHADDAGGEERQVVLRRPVRPVQVLQRQNERTIAGRRDGQHADRLEGPPALRLRIEVAKGLVLARQLKQLAEERQDVVRTGLQLLHTPAKLFLDLQRRVPLLDLETGPEDLEERQVGCAVAIGRALALEPRDRLTLQRLPELEQQPRLADTRLADDTHDLALPGSRALPALAEEAQLPPSTRQGTQPALHADLEAAAPRAPPRDVEDPHRLGPALDGDGPQRLGADVALHGPVRGLGHEHVAGLGERLQARGEVASCRRWRCSPSSGRCRRVPTTTGPVWMPMRTRSR